MTIEIYKKLNNIYSISIDNKIYNLVLNYEESHEKILNSYLKGGIIQLNKNIDINDPKYEIKFPYNLLIDNDISYDLSYEQIDISNEISANSKFVVYDKNVWTKINNTQFKYNSIPNIILDISNIEITEEPKKKDITNEIETIIKDIRINVEQIKNLYNKYDIILQNQWFMDYVDFSKFKDATYTNENREKEIVRYINNIHKLSQNFQINNNHQMKLLFQIFFNLNDTCIMIDKT